MLVSISDLIHAGLGIVLIVDILMYAFSIFCVVSEYRNNKNNKKAPVTKRSLTHTIIAFTAAFSFAGLYSAFLISKDVTNTKSKIQTYAIYVNNQQISNEKIDISNYNYADIIIDDKQQIITINNN